ncbi:hypothetical protein F5050DRAFT_1795223 [Lentinula boryana]|uniref:UVR domain-containing protein n=1 Tax=Lentinula boryana TaxID=40481 RepID=A0ABQ8PY71_9AGAR|nr:hypothetical protein F5050DRAFT_1795223 [Lentinula boryana]
MVSVSTDFQVTTALIAFLLQKIRIVSAGTLRVRLLEEQVERDFTEAVRLRERVRHLRSEVEIQTHRTQTTNVCLLSFCLNIKIDFFEL